MRKKRSHNVWNYWNGLNDWNGPRFFLDQTRFDALAQGKSPRARQLIEPRDVPKQQLMRRLNCLGKAGCHIRY